MPSGLSAMVEGQGEADAVLGKYFNLLKKMDYNGAYRLLSEDERKDVKINEFSEYMKLENAPFVKIKNESDALYKFLNSRRYYYRIIKRIKIWSGIKYHIEFSVPDYFTIAFDLMNKAPELDNPKLSKNKRNLLYQRTIKKLYPKGLPPVVKSEMEFILVREDGGYKINSGLKKKIDKHNAKKMTDRAFTLKIDRDITGALDLYRKAAEIDSENIEIKRKLKSLEKDFGKKIELLNKKRDSYIEKYIKIDNIKPVKGKRPNLYYTVKNSGNMTVTSINLIFIYYDKERIMNIDITPFKIQIMESLGPGQSVKMDYWLMNVPGKWDWKSLKIKVVKAETYNEN